MVSTGVVADEEEEDGRGADAAEADAATPEEAEEADPDDDDADGASWAPLSRAVYTRKTSTSPTGMSSAWSKCSRHPTGSNAASRAAASAAAEGVVDDDGVSRARGAGGDGRARGVGGRRTKARASTRGSDPRWRPTRRARGGEAGPWRFARSHGSVGLTRHAPPPLRAPRVPSPKRASLSHARALVVTPYARRALLSRGCLCRGRPVRVEGNDESQTVVFRRHGVHVFFSSTRHPARHSTPARTSEWARSRDHGGR